MKLKATVPLPRPPLDFDEFVDLHLCCDDITCALLERFPGRKFDRILGNLIAIDAENAGTTPRFSPSFCLQECLIQLRETRGPSKQHCLLGIPVGQAVNGALQYRHGHELPA